MNGRNEFSKENSEKAKTMKRKFGGRSSLIMVGPTAAR